MLKYYYDTEEIKVMPTTVKKNTQTLDLILSIPSY